MIRFAKIKNGMIFQSEIAQTIDGLSMGFSQKGAIGRDSLVAFRNAKLSNRKQQSI